MNKKSILLLGGIIIIALVAVFIIQRTNDAPKNDEQNVTQDIDNEADKKNLIRVESPQPNQLVSSPLEIRGEARGNWFFEASFPARLLDATGKELAIIPVQAQSEWMTTDFVPFSATLNFVAPTTATGTLVLEKDNPSGLPENADQLVIPVRFTQASAAQTVVKVFFGNSRLGAECEQVNFVTRTIPKTTTVGQAVIEELLKGPTSQEINQGYSTAINPDVKLNSLIIDNGVARADFSEQLGSGVAGSCRVNAIRAQIIESLKQFPTVKEAIISINGKTDDVLQP